MSHKRSGKSAEAAARRAVAHARELSEFHAQIDAGTDGMEANAFASPATGACFITINGQEHCDSGITRASCIFAANKAGGTPRWVPGGEC